MISLGAVVYFVALTVVAATQVEQCSDKNIPNLSDSVQIMPCKKIPCVLKRSTVEYITIKFTPAKDINEVKNHVKADVFGVPLPFIGVDGNSICNKIFTEDDIKASCPLKAGTTYKYKDSFDVLPVYPQIPTRIHWALLDGDDDFMCFEVNARIK